MDRDEAFKVFINSITTEDESQRRKFRRAFDAGFDAGAQDAWDQQAYEESHREQGE